MTVLAAVAGALSATGVVELTSNAVAPTSAGAGSGAVTVTTTPGGQVVSVTSTPFPLP